jgi:sugar lactone lactonase YvrE
MAMAANGDVYITDLGNFRVRRIAGGQVQTVAGDGKGGYLDDDNPLAAELYGLEGLSVVPDGSMVYVADGNRGEAVPFNRIRQVKLH